MFIILAASRTDSTPQIVQGTVRLWTDIRKQYATSGALNDPDPDDRTRFRLVILADGLDPIRLRVLQWTDLGVELRRAIPKSNSRDMAANWEFLLTHGVNTMSPEMMHELFGGGSMPASGPRPDLSVLDFPPVLP